MRQIDFDINNYEHKEELKTFVNSINELIDKYDKSFANADAGLKKIVSNIDKKNAAIEKLVATGEELAKREEELKALKVTSNDEIKELEAKKKTIEFTDSEVQKMEIDDLDALITARKNKIAKIDTKVDSTKEKIKANNDAKKASDKELKELEQSKAYSEESLYRTEALLKLVRTTKETFNLSVKEILESEYIRIAEPSKKEVVEEIQEQENDFSVVEFELEDMDTPNVEIEEPTIDIENTRQEETVEKEVAEEQKTEEEKDELSDTQEMSILDFSVEDIPEETQREEVQEEVKTTADYRELLDDVFNKEAISFQDFEETVQGNMLENAERVIKNVVVLKKHQIPLELTLTQSDIYTDIDPQDLDDLLNIITTDDDGNGMGFSIDYTFYCLNELAKINVDRLIDVYNNEFMNVNAKSGIIGLLKLTNPDLGDFANNRNMNIETMKTLGITTVEDIAREYPEFVNLDNPLFLNTLNIFDKDDLVNKMNADIGIVPKILDYWKNN